MKVAFYMTTILEYYGGVEKWMIDTSLELSKRHPNLEISIITRDDKFTEILGRLFSFIKMKPFNRKRIYKESFEKITAKLGKVQYKKAHSFSELREFLQKMDVVYSKNEILEATIFKYFIGYNNIKHLIFGCHTALYYPFGNKIHNILYTSNIYNILTSGVRKFHVLNSTDAMLLTNQGRDVVQIPNPINIEQVEKNFVEYDFPINTSKHLNIIWLGRLTHQKGIHILEQIIQNLDKKYSQDLLIHIVGDGEERKKIEHLAENYNFLKFYGHIENKYIPSFLSKMDLLLHTSLWESFGLTIVEANMQNIPVLAFDIPGPKDIIKNGENGFVAKTMEDYMALLKHFIDKQICINSPKKFIIELLNDEKIYAKYYELFCEK